MTEEARAVPSFPATEGRLAGATVLQIIPDLDAGGAERTTVDVAAALTAAGGRALVATEGGRLVGELQAKGGHWLRFPAASKNPLKMALNTVKLAALCKREGVHLIHARSRAPAWVGLGAARRLGLPFVCEGGIPDLLYTYLDGRGTFGHYVEYVWASEAGWKMIGWPEGRPSI